MSADEITIEFEGDWFDIDGWTSIPNRALRDGGADGLSWEARGMHHYFASHSKTFQITMAELQRQGNCGRERTRRILAELEAAGYITRAQSVQSGGRYGVTRYRIRAHRTPKDPQVATGDGFPTPGDPVDEDPQVAPVTGFPPTDEPPTDEPPTENRTPYKNTTPSEHHLEEHQHPSSSTAADAAPDQSTHPIGDRTTKPEPDRADVEELCVRLRDHVVANGGNPPTITQAWRRDARLLLDRDERPLERALKLVDWCQADPFWSTNILSMRKFRAQYDQLRMKANAQWNHARGRQPESVNARAVNATEAAWARWDAERVDAGPVGQTNGHTNGHRPPLATSLPGGGR